MRRESFDKTLAEAMQLFHKAYQEAFPPVGGDQADHDEAMRAGVEAVLIGTPIQCDHCGEWT